MFLLQRRPSKVPDILILAKLTILPLVVSIAALLALPTIYPGLGLHALLLAIWQRPEHRDGAQLHLLTIRRQVSPLVSTLNRLLTNRLSLLITRKQHSRPRVLRSVRGPVALPILAVPTLLKSLRGR